MSKINKQLTIAPPKLNWVEDYTEHFYSAGHKCPCCNGSGFKRDANTPDWDKIDCPVCHGSRSIDAHITIRWQAAETLTL